MLGSLGLTPLVAPQHLLVVSDAEGHVPPGSHGWVEMSWIGLEWTCPPSFSVPPFTLPPLSLDQWNGGAGTHTYEGPDGP